MSPVNKFRRNTLNKKLIPAVVASMFAAQIPLVYADSTQDLIDALVVKGVLTEDEASLFN